jgi:anti-sigma factor RsiW
MSGCTRSLDYLLEAELGELSGDHDTEIGRHVRECECCQRVAHRMLDSTARLDAALSAVPDGFDVDALVERATFPEVGAKTATVTPLRRRRRHFAAAALAASIMGLLVLNDWDGTL